MNLRAIDFLSAISRLLATTAAHAQRRVGAAQHQVPGRESREGLSLRSWDVTGMERGGAAHTTFIDLDGAPGTPISMSSRAVVADSANIFSCSDAPWASMVITEGK